MNNFTASHMPREFFNFDQTFDFFSAHVLALNFSRRVGVAGPSGLSFSIVIQGPHIHHVASPPNGIWVDIYTHSELIVSINQYPFSRC